MLWMSYLLHPHFTGLLVAAKTVLQQKTGQNSGSLLLQFTIRERLHTQHQTFQVSSEASRALVVVSDAALKEAVQRFFPKVKTGGRAKQVSSTNGYHEGQQAGRTIALNQALPSRRNT